MIKKTVKTVLGFALFGYIGICTFLYFQQESMIFFPKKLSPDYEFQFEADFDEIYIPTTDSVRLHGLLFHSDSAKGLIIYLHGNSGGMDRWGGIASNYTNLGYDMFILDYRGYGKSEGEIYNEEQFFGDVQAAYNKLKSLYQEDRIIVIGYSIGTGSAAMLAANNSPRQLILQAPYYSLVDLMEQRYPFIPTSLLSYQFETYKYVEQTTCPIAIFHGNNDRVIYYGSSEKLARHYKASDEFITLDGLGHNGINDDMRYFAELNRILN